MKLFRFSNSFIRITTTSHLSLSSEVSGLSNMSQCNSANIETSVRLWAPTIRVTRVTPTTSSLNTSSKGCSLSPCTWRQNGDLFTNTWVNGWGSPDGWGENFAYKSEVTEKMDRRLFKTPCRRHFGVQSHAGVSNLNKEFVQQKQNLLRLETGLCHHVHITNPHPPCCWT